jgi:hypothetical protein
MKRIFFVTKALSKVLVFYFAISFMIVSGSPVTLQGLTSLLFANRRGENQIMSSIVKPGQLPPNATAIRLYSRLPEVKARVHEMLDEVGALDNSPADKVSTKDQVAILDHSIGSEVMPKGLARFFKKPTPAPVYSGTAEFSKDGEAEFLQVKEQRGQSNSFYYEKLPDGSQIYAATLPTEDKKSSAKGICFIENPNGTVYMDETYGSTYDIVLPLTLIEMNSDQGGEWVESKRPDTATVMRPVAPPVGFLDTLDWP